jgi:hypothetical protein
VRLGHGCLKRQCQNGSSDGWVSRFSVCGGRQAGIQDLSYETATITRNCRQLRQHRALPPAQFLSFAAQLHSCLAPSLRRKNISRLPRRDTPASVSSFGLHSLHQHDHDLCAFITAAFPFPLSHSHSSTQLHNTLRNSSTPFSPLRANHHATLLCRRQRHRLARASQVSRASPVFFHFGRSHRRSCQARIPLWLDTQCRQLHSAPG